MIGICASMQEELAFVKELKIIGEDAHECFRFTRYEYQGETLVCGVCGTGKASAAAFTQSMIVHYRPSLIVNIGTAGSLGGNVRCKDVVVAADSVQHDFDLSDFGYQKGELAELKTIALSCDEDFFHAAKDAAPEGIRVHYGRILTGDRVVADEDTRRRLTSLFGGLCAEMEGAAVGQVCAMNNVPYGIIRGISDGEEADQLAEFRKNTGTVAELNGRVLLAALARYMNRAGMNI